MGLNRNLGQLTEVITEQNGRIGVTNINPSVKLDVIDNNSYQLRLANSTGNYSSGGLYLGAIGTSDPFYYGIMRWDQSDQTLRIGSQHGNAVGGMLFLTGQFNNSPIERMRITSGGNVGIGTTNPQDKFVISNAGAHGLEFTANSTFNINLAAYNRATSAYIPINFDASKFTFQQGNVLIGTTTDTGNKLQVNGSISATSLSLSGNYNASVTTNSSWTSFQTMIPTGVLQNNVTFLISVRWDFSSGSNQPYYCYCSFLFNGAFTNSGGGTDNEFIPMCSTHTGGMGSTISFRAVAGLATTAGIQARLNNFSTTGGVLTVKAIRLE